MVVTYNDVINAIAKAQDTALMYARSRATCLRNGETPPTENGDAILQLRGWINILQRIAANWEEGCATPDGIAKVISNINILARETPCDVSRTFSKHSSSGNNPVPSTYVERVLGLYVDNTNPSKPIIKIFVNPATISGNGTQSSPFSAIGGGGGSGTVNAGTQYRLAYYAANGTAVSQASAITALRALKSDANGVPTHFDTATEPTLAELAFVKGVTSAIQTQINAKLTANAAIAGATKTKVTYDANGLVTAGADATTSDIAEGSNLYFTDARVAANSAVAANTAKVTNATHTGDATGSTALTLATVNSNVGSFTNANITVNAKGLITAAANGSGSGVIQTYILSTHFAAPADATIYYLGINPTSMFTTANRRDFKFPVAHTITTVSLALDQSINGSGETVTIYLRNITTGTDYTIGTFASNFGAGISYKFLFTPLSIAVNTTDDWAVKILTPTWATNPTNWTIGMILSGN